MRGPLPHPASLAARAAGLDRWLGWAAGLAGLMLIAGWALPIMTVERLIFLSREISILEGIGELWAEGEAVLAVVIALFSVVLPAVKLVVALILWYGGHVGDPRLRRTLGWMEAVGRWSMLDVFVVAVIVVAVRGSLIDDVSLHLGLYLFTAAIVLSLVVVQRMTALARRALADGPPSPTDPRR